MLNLTIDQIKEKILEKPRHDKQKQKEDKDKDE